MEPLDVEEMHSGEYPANLEAMLANRPLYAIGNTALLDRKAIGICGSREASPSALKWARRFGREASEHGLAVVSGFARGVDREAHIGALESGGATIAVLPEGINHLRFVKSIEPLVHTHTNFLAISMFNPDTRWTVWQAMERNKLIVALSLGLFVIEAKEHGGTINAAHEAVRQGKRLWAIAYSKDIPGREGNRKLLATSAIPLKHMGDLRRALEDAMEQPPAEVRQLVMSLVREVNG